jgi:hypothetical protein
MKVRGLAAGATLLLFAAALGAQASTTPAQNSPQSAPSVPSPDWKTYTYAPDGFSASFPSAPDVQKRNIATDAGSFELHSYIGQVGEVAMFIGVVDYGSGTSGKDPNTLLQGAKNGALENSKSKLVSEKQITLGAYPGLTFEAESDQAHFSVRFYMVGSTLYQMLVVYPLGKPFADTARFLDSFQLIAQAEKPAA